MCGIVGLLVKNPALRNQLGALMVPMLVGMTERGPDSAGLAVYTAPVSDRHHKLSLYSGETAVDWSELLARIAAEFAHAHELEAHGNHAVLTTAADPDRLSAWLARNAPGVAVLSVGQSIDLYKDVGAPADIARRYGFSSLRGSHLVGHTRMATESAVTPAHAHPFTAGRDFCLVHNGSLSNPHLVRKRLEPLGIEFETDNDTEAACRFFEWRLREGDDLKTAVQRGFTELDGFYTFLMGTHRELLIVRDAFACKPAVVAETDDYVAIASEFRSLAHLPNISRAAIFEPKPEEIYSWRI
jgi:methylamine---glutamate N-methyltransferase subunit A